MFVSVTARESHVPLPPVNEIQQRMHTLFPHDLVSTGPQFTHESSGLTIDAWLRLDNRDALAAALGTERLSDNSSHSFSHDAQLVLRAYLAWGPDCVDRLEGDFAFAITDSRNGSVFIARDAMGVRPLYYALTDDVFVASPSAAAFDLFDGIDTSIRSEWVVDYLHGRSGDVRDTPFAGVKRLPPGHWLAVTGDQVKEHRYHQFSVESEWEDARDPRWLEAYRTELIRAVSDRTSSHGLIGVETSGGIDSSTILGVMAHTHPERIDDIHTFGFALAEWEPEYILETSAAHGVRSNHIFTAIDSQLSEFQRAWRVIGYPTEHANAVIHTPFYELGHQLGVRTLHSGHGGDELVTNAAGLAIQELLARGQWRQALQDLPGPRLLRPARLVKQWRRRTGDVSHLTAPMMTRLELTPVRAEAVAERDVARRTFAASRYSAPYSRINDFLLGDRLSAMTSIRTADGSLVAASYGVDYRWPLFDRRLIAQYLRTPAVWKYGEGYGRYLHRRAIVGMVPDKVAWKPSKDMGPARSPWLRQRSTEATLRTRGTAAPASAAEFLEQINPQVAELIDPVRMQMLLQVVHSDAEHSRARAAGKYLRSILQTSAWMDDRAAE